MDITPPTFPPHIQQSSTCISRSISLQASSHSPSLLHVPSLPSSLSIIYPFPPILHLCSMFHPSPSSLSIIYPFPPILHLCSMFHPSPSSLSIIYTSPSIHHLPICSMFHPSPSSLSIIYPSLYLQCVPYSNAPLFLR